MTDTIDGRFSVDVPPGLEQVWGEVGSGYLGGRLLYFFGGEDVSMPRDSLVSWNCHPAWKSIFPVPSKGGPLFFAETCFGEQLGFRWENGQVRFVLFVLDTFELFVVAEEAAQLFEGVLTQRDALTDPERYERVEARLGPLPLGMHYAPIVSPMVGGSGDAANFCIETPNAHLRTALATFEALGGSGTGEMRR